MKYIKYLALLPLGVLGVVAIDSTKNISDASVSDTITHALDTSDTLSAKNTCADPFGVDYMEVLESDDDSILFTGCGGLM